MPTAIDLAPQLRQISNIYDRDAQHWISILSYSISSKCDGKLCISDPSSYRLERPTTQKSKVIILCRETMLCLLHPLVVLLSILQLAVLASGSADGGGFVITEPAHLALAGEEHGLSEFAYYGPRRMQGGVSGPATVRDGDALCNPDEESVRGKIVIMGTWCDTLIASLDTMYQRHEELGALALVFIMPSKAFRAGSHTITARS